MNAADDFQHLRGIAIAIYGLCRKIPVAIKKIGGFLRKIMQIFVSDVLAKVCDRKIFRFVMGKASFATEFQ